jgi:hypothetical protein
MILPSIKGMAFKATLNDGEIYNTLNSMSMSDRKSFIEEVQQRILWIDSELLCEEHIVDLQNCISVLLLIYFKVQERNTNVINSWISNLEERIKFVIDTAKKEGRNTSDYYIDLDNCERLSLTEKGYFLNFTHKILKNNKERENHLNYNQSVIVDLVIENKPSFGVNFSLRKSWESTFSERVLDVNYLNSQLEAESRKSFFRSEERIVFLKNSISKDIELASQMWREIDKRNFDYDSTMERVVDRWRLKSEIYKCEDFCEAYKAIERGLTLEEYLVLKAHSYGAL